MREIEFRAWLKDKKMMVEVEGLDFEHKYIEIKEYEDDDYVCYAGFDEIELMQWTGQRDNTRTEEFPIGKKIFEGDIVESENFGFGTVYYDEECGQYLVKFFDEGYMGIGHADIEFKIIGNIYENHELLEEL